LFFRIKFNRRPYCASGITRQHLALCRAALHCSAGPPVSDPRLPLSQRRLHGRSRRAHRGRAGAGHPSPAGRAGALPHLARVAWCPSPPTPPLPHPAPALKRRQPPTSLPFLSASFSPTPERAIASAFIPGPVAQPQAPAAMLPIGFEAGIAATAVAR
jgi:hypothetical protein